MEYREILVEKRAQTTWIYLNRPDEMNLISKRLAQELHQALRHAEKDNDIRVLVLSGKGKAFCAGADLKEFFADIQGKSKPVSDFLDQVKPVFQLLRSYPKPVSALRISMWPSAMMPSLLLRSCIMKPWACAQQVRGPGLPPEVRPRWADGSP